MCAIQMQRNCDETYHTNAARRARAASDSAIVSAVVSPLSLRAHARKHRFVTSVTIVPSRGSGRDIYL